jgi:membrane-associated protein
LNASLIEQVIEVLEPLFSTWGYLIVFGGTFLESIFLTGWIAPGTAVILLGSFYAAQGELDVYAVAAVAAAGAFLGDNVGFLIGRKLGIRVLTRYGHRPRMRRGIEVSERWFQRYGAVTVLMGRMVSGVDAFIPVSAGMGGMPYWKYILFDVPGIMIFSSAVAALGYLFGENWEAIVKIIDWFGWGLLGVVVVIAGLAYIVHRRKAKKQAQ